jgi:hypothetical protein
VGFVPEIKEKGQEGTSHMLLTREGRDIVLLLAGYELGHENLSVSCHLEGPHLLQ